MKDYIGPDPVDIGAGARIRIRRRMMNLSQSDLAAALGVSFQQVQKYERGTNRVSLSMAVRIAKKLKMTVAEIVGEVPGAGGQVLDADTLQRLSVIGASELLKAYCEIEDGKVRVALLTLANIAADPKVRTRRRLKGRAPCSAKRGGPRASRLGGPFRT
jgi:transcriptional regulator with XRE-family HTH domain